MSERELCIKLLDSVPECKIGYVLAYLQGAAIPDEIPNAETLEAMEELDGGGGQRFSGTTDQLFAQLMED